MKKLINLSFISVLLPAVECELHLLKRTFYFSSVDDKGHSVKAFFHIKLIMISPAFRYLCLNCSRHENDFQFPEVIFLLFLAI